MCEWPTFHIRCVNELHFTYDLYWRRFLSDDDGAWDGDDNLRFELTGLRLKQLYERAVAEGVDEIAHGDALDADDPKSALIDLLIGHMANDGTR